MRGEKRRYKKCKKITKKIIKGKTIWRKLKGIREMKN